MPRWRYGPTGTRRWLRPPHELGMRQAVGAGMAYARLQLGSTILVLIVAVAVPAGGNGVQALLPLAVGYIIVQVICVAAVQIFSGTRRPWMRGGEVPA